MTTFAPARERNHSTLRHSSRSLPLKLSALAFCQGLPGSISAVLMPAWASHSRTSRLTNSGPLSERRKSGAPCRLTRRVRTSISRFERIEPATSMARYSRVNS